MATENNWIKTNLSNRRFNPLLPFIVTLQPYYFDELSFQEAADYTARKIYSKHKKLFLSFSGGADSDFVFHCLVRNNIPFTPVIVKTNGNAKELVYAFKTCEKFNITPHIIDLSDADFLKLYHTLIVKQINGRGAWSVPSILACEYARDNEGVLIIGEHMLDTMKMSSNEITPAMNEWDFYNEIFVGEQFNIPFFNYTVELFYSMVAAIRDDVSLQKFKSELYGIVERPITSYEFTAEFHELIKAINLSSKLNIPNSHWSFRSKKELLSFLDAWKRPKNTTYKSMTTLPQLHLGYYVFKNKIYVDRQKILDDMFAQKLFDLSSIDTSVEFVFNDDVFGHIDWTLDPNISLKQLYRERAQQLRDTYDYLILSYSGGSDSHEILYTFLENNIHIDEIQIVHFEKALARLDNNLVMQDSVLQLLKEYEFAALPNLKYVTDNFPNIKINTIDASDFLLEDAASGKFQFWGMQGNAHNATFLSALSGYVRPYFQHYYNNMNFNPKGKTAFIRGVDKPILGIKNNRLIFKFSDVTMHTLNLIESGHIDSIYTLENFFWSRDVPLIPIKQTHVIKNVLENDITFYARFMANQENSVARINQHKPVPGSDNNFQRHYCKYIYYHWSPTIFAAPKSRESPDFKLISLINDKNYAYDAAKENSSWFMEKYKYVENKSLITRHITSKDYDVGEFKPKWS